MAVARRTQLRSVRRCGVAQRPGSHSQTARQPIRARTEVVGRDPRRTWRWHERFDVARSPLVTRVSTFVPRGKPRPHALQERCWDGAEISHERGVEGGILLGRGHRLKFLGGPRLASHGHHRSGGVSAPARCLRRFLTTRTCGPGLQAAQVRRGWRCWPPRSSAAFDRNRRDLFGGVLVPLWDELLD